MIPVLNSVIAAVHLRSLKSVPLILPEDVDADDVITRNNYVVVDVDDHQHTDTSAPTAIRILWSTLGEVSVQYEYLVL
jgi:hypothetical protein